MKIYIPDLGDSFSVAQLSWSAVIKKDSKSTVALKLLKLYNQPGEATVTLPAGTKFTIDDISDEFNTIDVSKYWLQVIVDPTETEIVSFSCGVDGNPPPVALGHSGYHEKPTN